MKSGVSIRRRLLPLALAAAGLLHGASASALTLMQAYEAALQNDPTYRAAYQVAQAGKENRILARSNLLPSLSAAYSINQNRSTVEEYHIRLPEDYLSRSATIQVRQPVFSLDALARFKQGKAQADYAEAQFDSASQDVLMRMLSSYFEVLFKYDQVAFAKAERDMYAEQRKVNDLLLKRGEGTATDALETQSRLDLAEASVIEAEDALSSARDTLQSIVGHDVDVTVLDQLRPGMRVTADELLSFEAWRDKAMELNPDIRTQRKNIEIARQEINKQRAGHAPRVDFVGTYGKTLSDSLSTVNQETTVRSIGFSVNIPIFNGGAVSATTRQAVANKSKAEADLDGQIDKVVIDLRKYYKQMVSSKPKIDALIKAVDSAQLLITATQKSIQGGVRINLDLLTAQRQLSAAQRDLAQARYGYILALLHVRADAGVLGMDDVRLLAAYFE